MRKLYIHLGTGKTGTTAIQSFLTLNRNKLKLLGYNYCASGFEGINHHHLCYNFNRLDPEFGSLVDRNLCHLAEEIATSSVNRHIVSSEYFPDVTEPEIEAMLGVLSSICEVNVVFYFRRQDHFLESWYAQIVKAGAIDSDIRGLRSQLISARIFDYEYHANKWASQIGKEHVKIRPYEKSQFVGGDIFSDFLDAVGFTCSNQFERIRNDPNPSLSRIQLSLARKLAPLVEQSDLSILLTPIKELDTQDSNFFLPPLERAQLLKEYRGTNNSVAEKYLNRGELFEDQLVSDMDSWRPLDHTPVDYTRRFFEYFQGKSGADFDRIRAALRAVLKEDSARNTF